ncbi:simple sugar transport system ATP-binding protein [Amaricoccus macauensis]|uniref:Simple sugar transport system ATP-binding protein n=1 Tax=Amaricoccus macauensis TaxID=57001 RepID=A0A840SEQ1_9RHOB|nr:ABC transporter ATP-binding protein [Amaricoccus macauensis]MBB5221379.1 simple sugar transport system ATP-binding protein [Amaricoccus macauensis]
MPGESPGLGSGAGDLAIELVGISKSFGPVQANRDIDLAVHRGTIHGIVGENGAGKSTLMSILYGFYQADSGEIRVNGKPTRIPDSLAAIRAGIGMVHQHFMLVEPFTVLENVVLGAEDGALLRPSLAKARAELKRLEREYELDVSPDAVVGELSVGLQQRVEILKALYRECDILILDEPTGVLTPAEADHLFRILEHLKSEGKTIILITHKLREIMAVTDAVSVMRRGEMVKTLTTSETSPAEIAELMVGRRVLLRVEKAPAVPGPAMLDVEGLRLVDEQGVERLRGIGLTLRAGEILGVAGVAGNGQSELLEVLAGVRPATSGSVRLKGAPLDLSRSTNAGDRREAGIAHIPEDRHRRGLVMAFDEWENSCLGYQGEARFRGPALTLDRTAIRDHAREAIERFDIRPASCDLKTANFSGGNQQKIVIAREMERDPDVLLVGQPTRGVDIGAIEFIHRQIVALRDRGKAILLVSVELDEIRALADRIIVMFDGRISGERLAAETDERELGLLMAGIDLVEHAQTASN